MINEGNIMALITCTECGKEFSDKAPACPNCWCPTEDIIREQNKQKQQENYVSENSNTDPVLLDLHLKYPINPEHAIKEYMKIKGISWLEARKIINEYYKNTPPPRFREYWESQNVSKEKKSFSQTMSNWQKEATRQESLRQQKKEEKIKLKCPSCKSTSVFPVDTQKKFSAGKFLIGNTIGYALAGPVGGIVGAATGIKGKNGKTKFICQSCGKVFEKKI